MSCVFDILKSMNEEEIGIEYFNIIKNLHLFLDLFMPIVIENIYSIHNLFYFSTYLCEVKFPIIDKKLSRSATDDAHNLSCSIRPRRQF